MNLFQLHGKHFKDDENRLTANLAIMLNEARRGFFPAFLRLLDLKIPKGLTRHVDINLQEFHEHESARSIVDAKIHLPGYFVVAIESKVGSNSISVSQALKYARWLATCPEPKRILVFVTQVRQPLIEAQVVEALRADDSASILCVFLLWRELFSLLRTSEEMDPASHKRCEQRIRKGLPVNSTERFANLFLHEVEAMAYDLSIIDDLSVGEVADVVIQTQKRWFMDIALRHNVWFPPSQSLNGLSPAKYVAYYQTADNDMPKFVSHVARIRKVWKRVTFGDVCELPEFATLFADVELSSEIATFKNREGFFHIASTDRPVLLAHPIPLGDPSTAKFLVKKRLTLTQLLSAKTTDGFLASKSR